MWLASAIVCFLCGEANVAKCGQAVLAGLEVWMPYLRQLHTSPCRLWRETFSVLIAHSLSPPPLAVVSSSKSHAAMASEDPGVGKWKVFIRPRWSYLFQSNCQSKLVRESKQLDRAGIGRWMPESTGTGAVHLCDLFWGGTEPHQC